MAEDQPTVIRLRRAYDATPEEVFDAWLDPAMAKKFLFATPAGEMIRVEIGARVGGKFVIVERRDGQDAAHYGEYLDIDRPRRLVFRFSTDRVDAGGDVIRIDIVRRGEASELTLTHVLKPEGAEYEDKVAAGWRGILEGLARALEDAA